MYGFGFQMRRNLLLSNEVQQQAYVFKDKLLFQAFKRILYGKNCTSLGKRGDDLLFLTNVLLVMNSFSIFSNETDLSEFLKKCPSSSVFTTLRKSIETAFSMITAKFGKVIKATSIHGFLTKLKLFIAAYSIDCFFKLPIEKQRLVFSYANQQFG